MEKVDREIWLRDNVERLQYIKELEAWYELPMTQKLIEGMVEKRASFLKVIDNFEASQEAVTLARLKRSAITWFIESILKTVGEKEFIEKELVRYANHIKEKGRR